MILRIFIQILFVFSISSQQIYKRPYSKRKTNLCRCRNLSSRQNERLYQGVNVNKNELTFIGSFYFIKNSIYNHVCTTSLLNEEWVNKNR